MRLSTRTKYGLRALFELAKGYGQGPIQLKIIAKRQGISAKYLEQLMTILKSAQLVRSIRGSKGGYVLAKNPGQIKLNECFRVLEGPVVTANCLEEGGFCSLVESCAVKQVWEDVQEAIDGVLEAKNLQTLVDNVKAQVV